MIKINDNFKRLIPPLSESEYTELEQSILAEGCRDPLCVWNDTIVFVIVTVIYLTKTPVDWAQVDEWLVLLTALLGYVVSVFSGKFTHDTIKGTPLIGYSYSEKQSKQ